MGCISSKPEVKIENPNVYKVINIDDDGQNLWAGQLEITSTDLILYRQGKDPTNWPLRCLRRYGYDSDLFSFESGRRCQTGSGIYAFRCRHAGSLFRNLQEHLQRRAFLTEDGVFHGSTNTVPRIPRDLGPINSVGVVAVNSMTPSTINVAYPNHDEAISDSSYLEPNRQNRFNPGARLGSIGSGPMSPSPISPGSPNSMNNILEVTALPHTSTNHFNSNVYQEFPMAAVTKKLSLDIPPQELAPTVTQAMLNEEETIPTYENTSPISVKVRISEARQYMNLVVGDAAKSPKPDTETPTPSTLLRVDSMNDPSRCYENMEPLLTHMRHSKPEIFSKVDLPLKSIDPSEPTTPTSPSSPSAGVTYVMLDLNNPNTTDPEDESLSNNNNNTATTTNNYNNNNNNETARKIGNLTFSNSFDSSFMMNSQCMTSSKSLGGLLLESPKKKSAGYATIDFHKTIALSNTMNTNSIGSPTQESGRRTRHS